jgi:hypothetical protein
MISLVEVDLGHLVVRKRRIAVYKVNRRPGVT